MVIDTSALIAILFQEPEADRLERAIHLGPVRELGTPSYVEAASVLRIKRGPRGILALDALLRTLDVTLVSLTPNGAVHARDAYDRYGKGRGVPGSVLNFGDCLAYGVAMDRGQPLLFKGNDFPSALI